MIFDLVQDFAEAFSAMPTEHPRRQTLKLLNEAIRRDLHFIDRHPTTCFQCMWNSCWWHDCPEAAKHYEPTAYDSDPVRPHSHRSGDKIAVLLSSWRKEIERRSSEIPWLRAKRPQSVALLSGTEFVLRHSSDVPLALAVSPDCERFATAGRDGVVRVWSAHSGLETAVLTGHESIIDCLDFSPDGRLIASGSRDETARIFNMHTGAEIGRLSEGSSVKGGEHILSIAFSPDGRHLATGAVDGMVRIWDTQTATIQRKYDIHGYHQRVESVAFSADGKLIAAGDSGGNVSIYDWQVGTDVFDWQSTSLLLRLEGHSGCVNDVSYSPRGKFIATASTDSTLRIWDATSSNELMRMSCDAGPMYSVAWSRDGKYVVSGGSDQKVYFWTMDSSEPQLVLEGHEDAVTNVEALSDNQVVTTSRDRDIRVWKIDELESTGRLQDHDDRILTLAFSRNGQSIVTGAMDQTARIWNAASGELTHCFECPTQRVQSVAFSADNRMVAVGGPGSNPDGLTDIGLVQIWDLRTKRPAMLLKGVERAITRITFSSENTLTASLTDQTQLTWDLTTGDRLASGELAQSMPEPDAFAELMNYAFNPAQSAEEQVFSAGGEGVVGWLPRKLRLVSIAHDGRTIAGAVGSHLYLFGVEGGFAATISTP